MSGDMNTALGNVLIMCMLIKAYMDTKGIKYRFVDNGDDAVVILEKKHQHLMNDLPKWFLEMGFNMKVEQPVYEMEHIEYCQCHPVQLDVGEYTMVRNFPSCI